MNARLALLVSSSLSNWQVRIFKGLKWCQALIQITLPLSCSHHRPMHAALAFFCLLGHPFCEEMCMLLLSSWWEHQKHVRSWSTVSQQRHQYHSQKQPIPSNLSLHIVAMWVIVQWGMGALLCCKGWIVGLESLIHPWACRCLMLELHQESSRPSE